jgi:hypothetical protein
MATDDPVFVDDVWTVFHHNVNDTSWTLESYKRLITLSSAEEFWGAARAITAYCANNMFFVMREHVFPCWDDPCNIDGGCVSVRVPIENVAAYWEQVTARLLCECLLPSNPSIVNGVSSSPKHKWCIFKIWLASDIDAADLKLPPGYVGTYMFKTNRDNICEDIKKQDKS